MSLTPALKKQLEKETEKLISAMERQSMGGIRKARSKLLEFLPKTDKNQDRLTWGTLQGHIGMASLILSVDEQDWEKIQAAIGVCEEAIEVLRTEDPEMADHLELITQHFSSTLDLLPSDEEDGEDENSEEEIFEEIAAYSGELTELPPDSPAIVTTKMALAASLSSLSALNHDPEPADQAILILRELLADYADDNDYSDSIPLISLALARLLTMRDTYEDNDYALEEAVTLYRENHNKISRKSAPDEWADTQVLYGEALMNLGARSNNTDMIAEGIAIQNATLSYWKKEEPEKVSEIKNSQKYYKNLREALFRGTSK